MQYCTFKLITALKAGNIWYVQGRRTIFPIKGVQDTNNFLLAKFHQYLENFG